MLTLVQSLIGVLPYVQIPDFHIGPLPIHPFGVLVVIGILVGSKIASKRAQLLHIDRQRFESLIFWTVASGIVISHMLSTIFYFPRLLLEQPWQLFMIHRGLSSFGGFFGAVAGFLFYTRKYKMPVWTCADALAYGLPFGWFFGRMGCSVVHDHPGHLSESFFAVAFPNGARFDLGLLELMLTPILMTAVILIGKRTKRPGAIITTVALVYPILRFPLDFLRAPVWDGGDIRYFGLTPGHYASIILFSVGIFLWFRSRKANQTLATTSQEIKRKKRNAKAK
ncbi:MAG: prolipoprotein diacylglyceryl transferase [Deltaproteobacteria bacterium]|nr:prolipoprotein diacylglyceryl transferase [Deltaproteobacteria bacterium]